MQSPGEQFSDESRRFLLEVKKGKTRKFVLVKHGVQIDRLIIFKNGSFDRVVRTARQDGAWGEMFWGTLDGDGIDIRFELSRADGFATPPGTDIRLKEFLRELAGLKLEPTYVIVDKLAPVEKADDDDSEDDSDANQGTDNGGAGNESSIVKDSDEDKFVRFLKSILPHVKRALATTTSFSSELQRRVRDAHELGRKREFELGLATLHKIGALTKRSLAEAAPDTPTSDSSDVSPPPKVAEHTRRQQWQTRLAAIEPRFQAAVDRSVANVDQLQMVMKYAQNEARLQQFVKALVGIDRLEKLLNDDSTVGPAE